MTLSATAVACGSVVRAVTRVRPAEAASNAVSDDRWPRDVDMQHVGIMALLTRADTHSVWHGDNTL